MKKEYPSDVKKILNCTIATKGLVVTEEEVTKK
jgi:hypothetical protein